MVDNPSNSINNSSFGIKNYFAQSIKSRNDKTHILSEIDRDFTVTKYLDTSSPVIIGHKPWGPKYDKENNLITHSYVGPPSIFKHKKGQGKGSIFANSSKLSSSSWSNVRGSQLHLFNNGSSLPGIPGLSSNNLTNTNKAVQTNAKGYFQVIEEKALSQLYNEIRQENEKHKKEENKKVIKSLPSFISEELITQEKTIINKHRTEHKSDDLLKYLSRRTKKNEEDLLMNNVDSYRLKRQVLDTLQNQIPDDIKFGNHKWWISLRRPEHFHGTRETYINVGNDYQPFWVLVKERSPKQLEKSRKPLIKSLNHYRNFLNNRYMLNNPKNAKSIQEVNSMNTLAIDGKNLLDFESEYEKEIAGKKWLYKRNQWDVLNNLPKMMQGTELEKSYEVCWKDQVIVQSYK